MVEPKKLSLIYICNVVTKYIYYKAYVRAVNKRRHIRTSHVYIRLGVAGRFVTGRGSSPHPPRCVTIWSQPGNGKL